MNKRILLNTVWIILAASVLLIACTTNMTESPIATKILSTTVPASDTPTQNASQVIQETIIPTPTATNPLLPTNTRQLTETFTPIPSDTPTASPTLLPASTYTPVPTPTSTESPTPISSPTPNMVMPAFYAVGGCANKQMGGILLTFCITSVTVNADRHMVFSVSWEMENIPRSLSVTKGSDQGNKKMYLIDNKGNRYDHIAGGGDAYRSIKMVNGVINTGWFEFGPPPEGAFIFSFYDDNQSMIIKGIDLTIGVVLFDPWNLTNNPLIMEFRNELWALTKADDGSIVLSHQKIDACSIQEHTTTEPQGKLKNNLVIGKVTFDIYGYTDPVKNLGIREYIAVSGLANLDPDVKPFFLVTIPFDNALPCIQDVSDVLATLSEKKP